MITFLSVLASNILLFYGVWRRKLMCFIPWMLMHAALFCEAVIAFIYCVVTAVRTNVSGRN